VEPGFYTAAELSAERYHSGPGVSNSGLKLLGSKTPAHFYAQHLDPDRRQRPSTQPQMIGTALHAAALEPEKFAAQYVVAPYEARNSAGYKAWAKDQDRLILMPVAADNVAGMRQSLFSHPIAGRLLGDAREFEFSLYAIDPETGVLCRARLDLLTHSGFIVDLKKCQDASPAEAARSIAKYGYHQQDAFYTDVFGWCVGQPPRGFAFIFIEELPPHAVAVYVLDTADRDRGRRMYRRALNLYARCLESGEWPGYPVQAQTLSLPAWARRDIDSMTLEG
jgi:exodeoxyribonuclease VIII